LLHCHLLLLLLCLRDGGGLLLGLWDGWGLPTFANGCVCLLLHGLCGGWLAVLRPHAPLLQQRLPSN
jgi:hypothetical protein